MSKKSKPRGIYTPQGTLSLVDTEFDYEGRL
jgi:hypothetical protein